MSAVPDHALTHLANVDDPVPTGDGWAATCAEEGVPVACARGAYFIPRWAVEVLHACEVTQSVHRRALRACLADRELREAVQAVAALFPGAVKVRGLFVRLLGPGVPA